MTVQSVVGVRHVNGELELDAATVRSVAAALADSAGELALLAERIDRVPAVAEAIRGWAGWTAADADALVATAAHYSERDAHTAATLRDLRS